MGVSLRLTAMMLGAAAVAGLALPAHAQVRASAPKAAFLASERLWSASLALPACLAPEDELPAVSARRRLVPQERHGELVGEFRSPAPIAATMVAAARACALRAGDQATTPEMLSGGAAGFMKFRAAFNACMGDADAGHSVGSMTLSIDTHCDW
jgi:hypothetical protein